MPKSEIERLDELVADATRRGGETARIMLRRIWPEIKVVLTEAQKVGPEGFEGHTYRHPMWEALNALDAAIRRETGTPADKATTP